ncbi:hypothetical protein GA0061098_101182 [Bradyrhizobium shewense]|uniref:Uncharacterized protein n=1 Tax=Bradyrhizobium shewense TaxID=1761772 RepID=A0A1C3X0F0_9BRAD|nr:hypothetical protein [Bradyrhizobium shewense]SCB45645.1 hypothetical protein GA0061098_101182 [Bradyrhizobium shewense]
MHYKYDGVDPRPLFEDHASGAQDHRTGLARSLAAAPARDRDLTQGHRVAFCFVTENLDTTARSGEFMFQLQRACAV